MIQRKSIQEDFILFSTLIGIQVNDPFYSIFSSCFQMWMLNGCKTPTQDSEIRFINQYVYDYLSESYEMLPEKMKLADISSNGFYAYVLSSSNALQAYDKYNEKEYRIPACLLWWEDV